MGRSLRVGSTVLVKSWLGVLLLMAFCVLACSTTASGLKARYAREQSCPADQVSITEAGGDVYRANGCGNGTEYICGNFAGFGDSSSGCHERGLNPHEPAGEPPPQNATVARPDLVGPR